MKYLIVLCFVSSIIGCNTSKSNDYEEVGECDDYEKSIKNSQIYYEFADSIVQNLSIICQTEIVFRNLNDSLARVIELKEFSNDHEFIPDFINNTINGTVIRMLEGKTTFEFSDELGAKWKSELNEVYKKMEEIGYGEFVDHEKEYFNFFDHQDCYNLYKMSLLKNELISIQLKIVREKYNRIEKKPTILYQSDPDTLGTFSTIPEKIPEYKGS